ncbi:unnamed protein product [Choristocarpus tenellus]
MTPLSLRAGVDHMVPEWIGFFIISYETACETLATSLVFYFPHAVEARNATFHTYISDKKLVRSHGLALFLHGAGFTGMSWALVTAHLKGKCCVVAPDMRGHGLTRTSDDGDLVYSSSFTVFERIDGVV